MPYQLLRLAYENGIVVEYYDFKNYRLEALYTVEPECPPVIALSKSLIGRQAHFRTVLSHELGHYFTTAKSTIPQSFLYYRDRIEIGRNEHRAMAWAARYLIPAEELEKAFCKGLRYPGELAEYFSVDPELAKLRMILYFEREKQGA